MRISDWSSDVCSSDLAGDHCLAEMAKVLKSCCHRKADLAVRYGGEELAVLLPDTNLQGALALAEQIRRSVIDKHITHAGSPTGYLTVSLGCYAFVQIGRAPCRERGCPYV